MVETYIGGPSNQTLFALTRLRLCMQSRAGDFVSIVRHLQGHQNERTGSQTLAQSRGESHRRCRATQQTRGLAWLAPRFVETRARGTEEMPGDRHQAKDPDSPGHRKQEGGAKHHERAVHLHPQPQKHQEQEEQRFTIGKLKEKRPRKNQQEEQAKRCSSCPETLTNQKVKQPPCRQREKVRQDQT